MAPHPRHVIGSTPYYYLVYYYYLVIAHILRWITKGKLKVSLCLGLSLSLVAYEELYAFSYNPKQNDQQREDGWQLIDLGAEYERMGVPCDQWQLTDVNRDFKVRALRLDQCMMGI